MLVFGPSQAGANEILAQQATVCSEDGFFNFHVLNDMAQYFSDHIWGRKDLISFHNALLDEAFDTSMEEDVIIGKKGFLYYGDEIDDIAGTNLLSEEELQTIAASLKSLQTYCELNGKQFLFTIAPNKSTLYDGFLPDDLVRGERSQANATRLEKYLTESQVNYLNLFEAFSENKEVLYLKHDSHWGNKGAALVCDLVNDFFERKSDYFGGDFSTEEPHKGDLYEMLYPAITDSEQDGIFMGLDGNGLEYEYLAGGENPNGMLIETSSGSPDSVYVFRDSFGITLHTFLADSFGSATFSRSTDFDVSKVGDADYILIEIVERNIDYLQNISDMDDLLMGMASKNLENAVTASEIIDEDGIKNDICLDSINEMSTGQEDVAEENNEAQSEEADIKESENNETEGKEANIQETEASAKETAVNEAAGSESEIVDNQNDLQPQAEAEQSVQANEPAMTPAEQKAVAVGYIGGSAKALKKAIGKPRSQAYAPSCLGDGDDGELYYDGFVVYTYKEGGNEEVTYVE